MAEISPKRQREELDSTTDDSSSTSKRQKPYNNILNLLDEDEEPSHELSQDLSAIFTTLQQELSSSTTTTTFDVESLPSTAEEHSQQQPEINEDESVKSVMRHLLEASDDELGIPNCSSSTDVESFESVENLPFAFTDNGLWEFEDVAANYYAVLQSELFM